MWPRKPSDLDGFHPNHGVIEALAIAENIFYSLFDFISTSHGPIQRKNSNDVANFVLPKTLVAQADVHSKKEEQLRRRRHLLLEQDRCRYYYSDSI